MLAAATSLLALASLLWNLLPPAASRFAPYAGDITSQLDRVLDACDESTESVYLTAKSVGCTESEAQLYAALTLPQNRKAQL